MLFVFAFAALGIHGAVLAGWASGNKGSLLGSLRAAAQMNSYEVTLGLAIIGIIMVFGSLELDEIARAQGELLWGIPKWGVLLQPVAFILFMTAAIAETKRVPFNVPEGESGIIGYQLEYSGMKFGTFMLTDFVESIMAAGVAATLFLGGWQMLLPISLANVFITGAVMLLVRQAARAARQRDQSSSVLERLNHRLGKCEQRRNVTRGGSPYLIHVHRIVGMNELVPHARDQVPRNGRLLGSELRRQSLDRLADQEKLVQDRRLGLRVREKSLSVEPLDEIHDKAGSPGYVQERCLIPQHRPSERSSVFALGGRGCGSVPRRAC